MQLTPETLLGGSQIQAAESGLRFRQLFSPNERERRPSFQLGRCRLSSCSSRKSQWQPLDSSVWDRNSHRSDNRGTDDSGVPDYGRCGTGSFHFRGLQRRCTGPQSWRFGPLATPRCGDRAVAHSNLQSTGTRPAI